MLVELLIFASMSPVLACDLLRDDRGRIVRSRAAVAAFRRDNVCPATGAAAGVCPGYVVDHVVPLKRCGEDAPRNMQWQTVEEAREKDRWE